MATAKGVDALTARSDSMVDTTRTTENGSSPDQGGMMGALGIQTGADAIARRSYIPEGEQPDTNEKPSGLAAENAQIKELQLENALKSGNNERADKIIKELDEEEASQGLAQEALSHGLKPNSDPSSDIDILANLKESVEGQTTLDPEKIRSDYEAQNPENPEAPDIFAATRKGEALDPDKVSERLNQSESEATEPQTQDIDQAQAENPPVPELSSEELTQRAEKVRGILAEKLGVEVNQVDPDMAYAFAKTLLKENPDNLSLDELAEKTGQTAELAGAEFLTKAFTELVHRKTYQAEFDKLVAEGMSEESAKQLAQEKAQSVSQEFASRTSFIKNKQKELQKEQLWQLFEHQFGEALGQQVAQMFQSKGVVQFILESMAGR